MIVLTIDTATPVVVTGVVAVQKDSSVQSRADRSVENARGHAEVLTTLMRDSLADAGLSAADLDAVVVGCGPGPFTGLRVGMATGAAFADALSIPAYGVCSLDAIAVQANSAESAIDDLMVVTDARRREVYWSRYRDGRRYEGPGVDRPDAVVASVGSSPITVCGSATHAALFEAETVAVTHPTPIGLAQVAADRIIAGAPSETLVPLYLRRPDAVERAPAAR